MNVRANLRAVAAEFRTLGVDVVFTGGASIAEYVDTVSPESIRPTLDVDVVVDVASHVAYAAIMSLLDAAGWAHPQLETDEHVPICRRRTPDGVLVDVIPGNTAALGFTNRWYAEGFDRVWFRDPSIRLFPVDILIVSKIEAFRSRGKGDWRASHDVEDIMTVFSFAPHLLRRSTTTPYCP